MKAHSSNRKRKFLIAAAIILGTAGLAVAGSAWWVKHNVYANSFQPVVLPANEQAALDEKMATLQNAGTPATITQEQAAQAKAAEETAKRTLTLSDREVNAKLAAQGMGEQFKVDFGEGNVAVTALLPVDKDFPILGGSTVRLRFAFDAKMSADKKFILSLKDVSIGGVPMPNAWLGMAKGVNLFTDESFAKEPALKAFADGICDFALTQGVMKIVLNE
jgi:hypothetical protein